MKKSGETNGAIQDWLDRIEDIAEDAGYFEPLGPDHSVAFYDASSTLFVSFESVAAIRADDPQAEPLGFALARDKGWSTLSVLAHQDTWFRHKALYNYFDRLVDDGFFEDFDQVVFYGAGICGYAAAAYSVVAPGATVIAIQPQATLDPRVAEWDDRFLAMRRTDFTSRYGFAPDMIEAADRAFILYDPENNLDSMHAALFCQPNVTLLRCRHFGHRIAESLSAMGILVPLLESAASGQMCAADFHRLFRARRDYPRYLRNLLTAVEDTGRLRLIEMLCQNVVKRMNGPRFRRRLDQVRAELATDGAPAPQPAPSD